MGKSIEMINVDSLPGRESLFSRKNQHTSSSYSTHPSVTEAAILTWWKMGNLWMYTSFCQVFVYKRLIDHFKALPCSLAEPKTFTRIWKGESLRIYKNKKWRRQAEFLWARSNEAEVKYSKFFSSLEHLKN